MSLSLRIVALPLVLGFATLSYRHFSAPDSGHSTRVVPLSPMTELQNSELWTSTAEVRGLQIAPNGRVWAATAGGILGFDGQKWTRHTRHNGLPSSEALQISAPNRQVTARFPLATAIWNGAKWESKPASSFAPNLPKMSWKNRALSVTLDGLKWGETLIAPPSDSTGTHISAAIPQGDGQILVAIYGDGLWRFDGARWTQVAGFPAPAREVTALAVDGSKIWVGTRRAGIFRSENDKWTHFQRADEPQAHNIQSLIRFQGVLWASTLDDGLICRTGSGWKHFTAPILSSSAPRQMTVWQNRLWVRHGGGLVDSFDGKWWTRNALADLPRRGVYAVASDEKRLYAAGWGGWSERDGAGWTAHFEVPSLKGIPVLGILPDGDDVYLATQSRGLGRWNRVTRQISWFDERDGLCDDWITALAKIDGKIYAGTFVGGLARLDGQKWHVFPEMRGLNVTAIESDGTGIHATTRHGMWKIEGDAATKVGPNWLDSEQQALFQTENGLWVGTRTSLNFLRASS